MKRQNAEWHLLYRPKKSSHEKIEDQINDHLFCLSKNYIYKEFVPQDQTVNQKVYIEVFNRLRKRDMRVRSEIATWKIYHERTMSHFTSYQRAFEFFHDPILGSTRKRIRWSEQCNLIHLKVEISLIQICLQTLFYNILKLRYGFLKIDKICKL